MAVILIRFPLATTCVIWHRLLHPRPHPLLRRSLRQSEDKRIVSDILWVLSPAIVLIYCWLGTSLLDFDYLSDFPRLVLILVLNTAVYVVPWVASVSISVAEAHQKRTFDLLSVTPAGSIGVIEAFCAAALHRSEAITWINFFRQLIIAIFLFIVLMMIMVALLRQRVFDLLPFVRLSLDVVALTAASYIDHVQTVVLGCLIGMLVPMHRSGSDAPIWALIAFVALQTVVLVSSLLAVIIGVPALLQALPAATWVVEIGSPLLSLMVFCGIREAFNAVLWSKLAFDEQPRRRMVKQLGRTGRVDVW